MDKLILAVGCATSKHCCCKVSLGQCILERGCFDVRPCELCDLCWAVKISYQTFSCKLLYVMCVDAPDGRGACLVGPRDVVAIAGSLALSGMDRRHRSLLAIEQKACQQAWVLCFKAPGAA